MSNDGRIDTSSADPADSDAPLTQNKAARPRRVYEAGAIILCEDKVVLRLTDEQHWIFPKGKVKKHESPAEAAMREATEETGLAVELIDEAADTLIRHEGKKRRFVFYLMRATGRTWDWSHHEGRDTFLIAPDKVSQLLRQKGYGDIWEAVRERVVSLSHTDVASSDGQA